MNRKEQLFKMKLHQFRERKQEQKYIQGSTYFRFREKVRKEILNSTGIDIDKGIQTPKFLNDLPFVGAIFQQLLRLKYFVLILLLAMLYEKYEKRMSNIDI